MCIDVFSLLFRPNIANMTNTTATARANNQPMNIAESRYRRRSKSVIFRLLTMSIAGAVALVGAELTLRLVRDDDQFFPDHPNTVRNFYPSNEITPGVTGTSQVAINSYGTRGPELRDQRIRILTVGGSTTACRILDDSETWPSLLMKNLNEAVDGNATVWVTNSGLCGRHSEHHVMHAKYLLPRLPRIDYMIVYAGINDVGNWLNNNDFDPHYLDSSPNWNTRVAESFSDCCFTSQTDPWFRHLQLWKRGSTAKARLETWRTLAGSVNENGVVVQDARLRWLARKQLKRQKRQKVKIPAAKRATLPAALDSYAANLLSIIDSARRQGTEPILMAQAMPGHTLSPEERKRLWMGTMDRGKTYVFHSERLDVLAEYNDRMRSVAAERDVLFLDLPSHLNTVKNAYYDGCHLNEHGCRETARFVAQQIRPHLKLSDVAHRHPVCFEAVSR